MKKKYVNESIVSASPTNPQCTILPLKFNVKKKTIISIRFLIYVVKCVECGLISVIFDLRIK